MAAPTPEWLLQTAQQIQAIDYELHAAIRIITRGQMQAEDIPVFVDACVKRDRLMSRLLKYLSEEHKQSTYHTVIATNSKP
jgi:hypothetical protein